MLREFPDVEIARRGIAGRASPILSGIPFVSATLVATTLVAATLVAATLVAATLVAMTLVLSGIPFASAAAGGVEPEKGNGRPNILLFLTDDQRWDAVGCMGNPVIQTPRLDRLAREGVHFTDAFVTTSICAPNRACILSGQHMRTHGIRDFSTPFSPEALKQTYPVILRREGYRTGFIGKWGVGADEDSDLELPARNFDYWMGFKQQGEYFHTVDGKRIHLTRLMAEQAREFLDGCEPGRPFCLSISFKAPHGPWADYDPALEDLYADTDIPIAETASREIFESLPLFIRDSLGGRRGGTDPERIRRLTRQYYRLITGVDAAVGLIMDRLRDQGFDDSTVVIFTSDNGHFLHEHGLHGKWLMYDESIRVPLIIRDPRLPEERRGSRCEEMVLSIDIAPTILSLAGCEIPASIQGRDLSPLLAGRDVPWRDDWFYEHTFTLSPPLLIPKSQGVRTRRWKYIRYISERPPHEQLFDLRNDPHELVNLSPENNYEETLDNLRKKYEACRRAIPNNNPDLDEYPEFKTVSLGHGQHDRACDFSGAESLGQTFRSEGTMVRSVRLATPTWMHPGAPSGLRVELYEGGTGGELLGTGRIPQRVIRDNKVHEVRFDCPVQKGRTLYLRVRAEDPVPERTLGWWGYGGDAYPEGSAFRNDEPQPYDHELRIVFKDG